MASPRALTIARTAERFGQSPAATYLGIRDPVLAVVVDEALALRLAADDARLAAATAARAKGKGEGGLDAGQRFATDADYAD